MPTVSTSPYSSNEPGQDFANANPLLALAQRFGDGDDAAAAGLRAAVFGRIRCFTLDQAGVHDGSRAHEVLLAVITAVRTGQLRDDTQLLGYAMIVAVRLRAAGRKSKPMTEVRGLDRDARAVEKPPPAVDEGMPRRKVELLKKNIAGLSANDREVLTRFYLREQTQERICAEMDVSDTQFHLVKSQAKAQLGRAIGRKGPGSLLKAFGLRRSG